MSPALSPPARRAAARPLGRLVLVLVPLGLALLAPRSGRCEGNPAGLARLRAVLAAGQAGALRLAWTQGADGAVKRLLIEGGQARLERCAPDCAQVGAPHPLTAGEQAVILSGLRSLELDSLRSSDEAALADRTLELAVAGTEVGRWQRARSDWPAPPSPSGEGLQPALDELLGRIERAASARRPVAIPQTAAELSGLRLKLQLSPSRQPGGLVIVEAGRVHVIPEEGSLARVPRPREHERPLAPEEEARILAGLKAIDWERIDTQVPRRAQPAIGDDDGRLATLHLLPAEREAAPAAGRKLGSGGSTPAQQAAEQPRGLKRYVADLQRSAAAPLISQLVSMLTAQASTAGAAGGAGAVARPQRGAK
ncbi:MAG: hypothetical protein U1A78_22450 [Polyangia bacterium]